MCKSSHSWDIMTSYDQLSLMNVFLFPLSSLLEILCSVLYDSLRPVIIHMNHMETLTELCSILKVSFKGGRSFVLKNSPSSVDEALVG